MAKSTDLSGRETEYQLEELVERGRLLHSQTVFKAFLRTLQPLLRMFRIPRIKEDSEVHRDLKHS